MQWAYWVHLVLAMGRSERRGSGQGARAGSPLFPCAGRSAASFPAAIHAKQLKLSPGRGGTMGCRRVKTGRRSGEGRGSRWEGDPIWKSGEGFELVDFSY